MSPTRMTLPRRGERGFTLVELLITVVIIAVLTAIAVPAYITVVANAQDSAARQSLAAVESAQEISAANAAMTGGGAPYMSKAGLADADLIRLGDRTDVFARDDCWVAQAKSESGKAFYATSNGPVDTDGTTVPDTGWCAPAEWLGHERGVLRTNLAKNPEAVGDLSTLSATGSSTVGMTSSVSSEQARSGTSFKRVANTTGDMAASFRLSDGDHFLAPGEQMSWSVWVYSTAAFSGHRWCDANTAEGVATGIGTGPSTLSPANTWVRITTSLSNYRTSPIDVGQCGIYAINANAGTAMYFDDILIERGPTGDWFSGSSGDTTSFEHQWTGDPHLSSSVQIGELPG